MRIGVIIPDRGDRPEFTKNCLRMLSEQTIRPRLISHVDAAHVPTSNLKDITKRYRIGYDMLRNAGLDVIFLIENDDYYAPNYIETQLNAWIEAGKPDLFGQRSTIYYHIKERGFFTMYHEQRSSAMSTLIKPDLNFDWCPDDQPFTDTWLYSQLKYKLWQPKTPISIGIKHGVGMSGGGSHATELERFTKPPFGTPDFNFKWLKSNVDPVSFEFYKNYFNHE